MQIQSHLVRQVEDKMLEVLLLAQEKFKRTFDLPKLSFDLHSNRIAGLACYSINTIKINPKYLIEHTEQILNRTVGHEIAHLLTRTMYPLAKQAHGPEWRHIMRNLGLPESRCHSMELTGTKPFRYICGCGEVGLTPIKHKRTMQDGIVYRCGRCKQNLRPKIN